MGNPVTLRWVRNHFNPLETGMLRLPNGQIRPIRTQKQAKAEKTQFKQGLLRQASCFANTIVDAIPPTFPASDFRDHARTLKLIETLQALPEIDNLTKEND